MLDKILSLAGLRRRRQEEHRSAGFPSLRTFWEVRHYDREGRLLWSGQMGNIYHDEGEEFSVKVLFTEESSVPANYYLGLDARSSLAEDDDLAALSGEPSGNGYSRQTVASDNTDFTAQQDGGTSDWEAVTKEVTFAASGGDWSELKNIFLATSSDGSGKLIASAVFDTPRTVKDGEELKCTMTIRKKEAA